MTEIIKNTMENLKRNNMEAYYCENVQQAKEKVAELLENCKTVSSGGSATLAQTGILDYIKSDRFEYLDRFKEGMTDRERREVFAKIQLADAYLMSSNAITENGELYNVDGNSNRVSALLYGPESVIIVAGVNKIVKNLDEAVMRVKKCAAPPNGKRLNTNTPCAMTGECICLKKDAPQITDGCRSKGRMCCNYVICAQQRHVNRIKVIIVNENLGF